MGSFDRVQLMPREARKPTYVRFPRFLFPLSPCRYGLQLTTDLGVAGSNPSGRATRPAHLSAAGYQLGLDAVAVNSSMVCLKI